MRKDLPIKDRSQNVSSQSVIKSNVIAFLEMKVYTSATLSLSLEHVFHLVLVSRIESREDQWNRQFLFFIPSITLIFFTLLTGNFQFFLHTCALLFSPNVVQRIWKRKCNQFRTSMFSELFNFSKLTARFWLRVNSTFVYLVEM